MLKTTFEYNAKVNAIFDAAKRSNYGCYNQEVGHVYFEVSKLKIAITNKLVSSLDDTLL